MIDSTSTKMTKTERVKHNATDSVITWARGNGYKKDAYGNFVKICATRDGSKRKYRLKFMDRVIHYEVYEAIGKRWLRIDSAAYKNVYTDELNQLHGFRAHVH